MIIKVCPNCKGDGFYRLMRHQIDPLTNVHGARPIRKPMKQTHHGELHDYYVSIIGYEFDCRRCRKTGELTWTRGKSLVPSKAK
jgi:RecJ-like exonuclease